MINNKPFQHLVIHLISPIFIPAKKKQQQKKNKKNKPQKIKQKSLSYQGGNLGWFISITVLTTINIQFFFKEIMFKL